MRGTVKRVTSSKDQKAQDKLYFRSTAYSPGGLKHSYQEAQDKLHFRFPVYSTDGLKYSSHIDSTVADSAAFSSDALDAKTNSTVGLQTSDMKDTDGKIVQNFGYRFLDFATGILHRLPGGEFEDCGYIQRDVQ